MLGGSNGSHQLHYLLENAFVEGAHGAELSDTFQEAMRTATSFAGHPLYALMHEAIYGRGAQPTDWSAERVRAEFPQFDAAAALAGDGPLIFTGESIHPWHFEVDPALRPCAKRPNCSPPAPTGPSCTTPTGSPPTRCRWRPPCTTTTCTWTRGTRCAPPPRSAACARG